MWADHSNRVQYSFYLQACPKQKGRLCTILLDTGVSGHTRSVLLFAASRYIRMVKISSFAKDSIREKTEGNKHRVLCRDAIRHAIAKHSLPWFLIVRRIKITANVRINVEATRISTPN